MTAEEFRGRLATSNDAALVGLCLRDEVVPFVFEPRPEAWDVFRDVVVSAFGGSRADITVIGSGRLGFSLKPDRNLSAFTQRSDIDLIVVNAGLFDALWLALLNAAYPRPPITDRLGAWLRERRNELYTGWISPLEIRLDPAIYGRKAQPAVDIRTQWFQTLKQASKHPPRRHEDIRGRLYRTWEHAELYHLNSLAALRRSLAS